MAENIRDILEQSRSPDKELRLRSLKDRQNEERQRKLEEIKAQVKAAQTFRDQKEEERRRRMEELRLNNDLRRVQVEERKRAINDAERDRLESILRRNQEREQRIESKRKNEKSNIVFAFGSSTPRMLDPSSLSVSTYWSQRRATSIQNIAGSTASLTRRQSERDLDVANKKRATSATGLERSGESSGPVTPAGCASGYLGRRRTDLVPTAPSRDSSFTSSRKSLNQSPGSSRPSSSLSQQSTNSIVSSVSMRQRSSATPRRPRPASIAVTGISQDAKISDRDNKPPLPRTRKSISKQSPSAPMRKVKSSVDPVSKDKDIKDKENTVKMNAMQTGANKPQQKPPDTAPVIVQKPEPVIQKAIAEPPVVVENNQATVPIVKDDSNKEREQDEKSATEKEKSELEAGTADAMLIEVSTDKVKEEVKQPQLEALEKEYTVNQIKGDYNKNIEIESKVKQEQPSQEVVEKESRKPAASEAFEETEKVEDVTDMLSCVSLNENNEMTTSVTKTRITTEEEAKAALAERRRLIREEAERQAELERQRLEAEAEAELQRQQQEEEQVRQLIEMQRQTEQQRLNEAIKEVQKREEEEKLKREEEQKLKELKEEAEKKAKEDAERQKAELQKRLENEEKERELRRKRVEAIMLRTRGRNSSGLPSQQSADEKMEDKSEESTVELDGGKVNGTERKIVDEQQENGTTKNGNFVENIADDIIPGELVKKEATVMIESMNSSDSINTNNSNNAWQDKPQFGNFVYNNNS